MAATPEKHRHTTYRDTGHRHDHPHPHDLDDASHHRDQGHGGHHAGGHDRHAHDEGHGGHGHGPGESQGHDEGHGGHRHGPGESQGHDEGHGGHRDGPGESQVHDEGHGGHGHGAGKGHDHGAGGGWFAWLRHRIAPHSHDPADKVDQAMEGSREGIRALWWSLAVLGVTALLQGLVAALSGSVALLGDTLHNIADALTAVPLGVAFLLGRRPATRRYTYGFGRAEDLAGIVIVGFIAGSSILAGYEALRRLVHPAGVSHLWAVAVAALVGFAGNEIVARYRITVGRRIGSAALVADGLHARTDGFTSLAVLVGAGGVALGWRWADPVIGLVITIAILFVLKDAAREVYRRLMDAVDPELVGRAERTLLATPGVLGVGMVRLRWIGHQLRAECEIAVDAGLTVTAAHAVAVAAEHRLVHAIPRLYAALVHADPQEPETDPHAELAHHRP